MAMTVSPLQPRKDLPIATRIALVDAKLADSIGYYRWQLESELQLLGFDVVRENDVLVATCNNGLKPTCCDASFLKGFTAGFIRGIKYAAPAASY